MLRPRIIPCLLVQDGGLVKTVEFRKPKYVGDPINAVRIYNEKEADELIVLDIDASVRGEPPNLRLIGHLAVECRMPLCYGGGVRSVEQAQTIVSLGVEKIALSSGFLETPDLVSAAAAELGRQSVVVVLDVKRNEAEGGHTVWSHNATRDTKRPVLEAALEAEARGAGEIVINSVDNDGTMAGYDLELAQAVKRSIRTPLTVLGGAGSLTHMKQLIDACGVVGVAAGSFFVFKGPYRAVLISYPGPAKKDELFRGALAADAGSVTSPA